jgi:hypothetical protein
MLIIKNFRFLFFVSILLMSLDSVAQTAVPLRLMTYNLLNYPETFTAPDVRYNNLRSIINHLKPDMMMVNELKDNGDARYADTLLNRSFNTGGVTYYSRASMITPNGVLNNMMFYRNDKLTLVKHLELPTVVRNFDYYRFLVKDANLTCHHDSTYISVITAHLKASNTPADVATRNTMATDMMAYAQANIPSSDALFIGGDFNFYDETEAGYMKFDLSAGAHNLQDVVGAWTRDVPGDVAKFTQTTRSTANPGGSGGITGGLDDRFDFLFIDAPVLAGTARVAYVPSSYKVFGNDGLHYNLAIIEGAPNAVISASLALDVFNTSDHYPVYCDLICTLPPAGLSPVISGTASVCPDQNLTYNVDALGAGCTYTWAISGGVILSGQGTTSVTVEWTPASSGMLDCSVSCP